MHRRLKELQNAYVHKDNLWLQWTMTNVYFCVLFMFCVVYLLHWTYKIVDFASPRSAISALAEIAALSVCVNARLHYVVGFCWCQCVDAVDLLICVNGLNSVAPLVLLPHDAYRLHRRRAMAVSQTLALRSNHWTDAAGFYRQLQVDSALYPPWDGKMSTSQRAVMPCG